MRTIKKRLERLEALSRREHGEQGSVVYADVYPPGWAPKSAAQKAALESGPIFCCLAAPQVR